MRILVLEPPEPILQLADAKTHLRIDDTDTDAQITALIAAVTAYVDGPTGVLGRALGAQTLQLLLDGFHHDRREERARRGWRWPRDRAIALPCPPLIAVTAVAYDDDTNTPQVLDPSLYRVTSDGVGPAFQTCWPCTSGEPECVRITYTAGYAGSDVDAGSGVPPNIRHAMLLLLSHYFQNRDAVVGVENRDSSTPLPLGVDALLAPHRVWSF